MSGVYLVGLLTADNLVIGTEDGLGGATSILYNQPDNNFLHFYFNFIGH